MVLGPHVPNMDLYQTWCLPGFRPTCSQHGFILNTVSARRDTMERHKLDTMGSREWWISFSNQRMSNGGNSVGDPCQSAARGNSHSWPHIWASPVGEPWAFLHSFSFHLPLPTNKEVTLISQGRLFDTSFWVASEKDDIFPSPSVGRIMVDLSQLWKTWKHCAS